MVESGTGEIAKRTQLEERKSQLAEVLNLSGEEADFAARMALFNQRLAMDFYRILSNGGNNQVSVAQDLVDALRNTIRNGLEGYLETSKIISGARAQAGVMDCLRRNDYLVMVPQTVEAVKAMDLNKVDLAAINKKDGKIYFVDVGARAREGDKQNQRVKIKTFERGGGTVAFLLNYLRENLRKASGKMSILVELSGLKRYPHVFVKVILPTGGKFMDISGRLSEETSRNLVDSLEKVPVKTWV